MCYVSTRLKYPPDVGVDKLEAQPHVRTQKPFAVVKDLTRDRGAPEDVGSKSLSAEDTKLIETYENNTLHRRGIQSYRAFITRAVSDRRKTVVKA